MSLVSMIGPRPNLLGHHAGSHYRLEVAQPILTNADLEKVRAISSLVGDAFRTKTMDCTWSAGEGVAGMARAVDRICGEATDAVLDGYNILILSDRAVSPARIPMPALLATAAVHNHLIRRGLRTSTGLVVETGEAREVHHFCVLAGYGAEAINPYLAFETLEQIREQNGLKLKPYEVQKNFLKAIDKGILKVMSKMGISTYQSVLRRADIRRGWTVQRSDREVLHPHGKHHRRRRLRRDRTRGSTATQQRVSRQPALRRHA